MNYYDIIVNWVREQWQELTVRHLIYLLVFSFILSYLTEYILKFKHIRWLYYAVSILLLNKSRKPYAEKLKTEYNCWQLFFLKSYRYGI